MSTAETTCPRIDIRGCTGKCRRLAFLELIWPCRRSGPGLAAVWIFDFGGECFPLNEALAGHGQIRAVIRNDNDLKDQQTILAELLTDRSAPRDVERQKTFLPKPHTETGETLTV